MARSSVDFHIEADIQGLSQLLRKIEEKAKVAAEQGKNFAVSPLHACEERPNVVGSYLKFKCDYMFVTPGDQAPAGWTLYETASTLGKNNGQPED